VPNTNRSAIVSLQYKSPTFSLPGGIPLAVNGQREKAGVLALWQLIERVWFRV
jgi:hypothetical protein